MNGLKVAEQGAEGLGLGSSNLVIDAGIDLGSLAKVEMDWKVEGARRRTREEDGKGV